MNLMENNETFGQYIMRMRYSKGFTQRKLAQISGISNTTISRIEKGETTKPDLPTLKVLAQHLDINESAIIKASGYEFYDKALIDERALTSERAHINERSFTSERPIINDRATTVPYMAYSSPERSNVNIEPKSDKEVPALKGVRLITLRLKRNITQKELGELLGVDKTAIAQYENQIVKPDYEILNRISQYFGVPVDYLVGKTDNPNDTAWRQQSPTASTVIPNHRDSASSTQAVFQGSAETGKIYPEYLEIAREMQERRIAPADIRAIMNVIIKHR